MSRFVLLVLVALAGCSRNSPAGGAAPPAATAKSLASATASAAPTAPAPSANPECQRFVQALEAELAKLASSCAADKDCTCYPGGVGGVARCGGVSDVAAAGRIEALTRRFADSRCDNRVNCAAQLCLAACVDGRRGDHDAGVQGAGSLCAALMLRDTPLLFVQSDAYWCPTCEKLLAFGWGREHLDEETLALVRDASNDVGAADEYLAGESGADS